MHKQEKFRPIKILTYNTHGFSPTRKTAIKIYVVAFLIIFCLFFIATFVALIALGLTVIFYVIYFIRKWMNQRRIQRFHRP